METAIQVAIIKLHKLIIFWEHFNSLCCHDIHIETDLLIKLDIICVLEKM